jgi:hypothetical protein
MKAVKRAEAGRRLHQSHTQSDDLYQSRPRTEYDGMCRSEDFEDGARDRHNESQVSVVIAPFRKGSKENEIWGLPAPRRRQSKLAGLTKAETRQRSMWRKAAESADRQARIKQWSGRAEDFEQTDDAVALSETRAREKRKLRKVRGLMRAQSVLEHFRGLTTIDSDKITDEDLRMIFSILDEDGSGLLDTGEVALLVEMFAGEEEVTDEQIEASMAQLDDDGSGAVEFDEFAAWWRAKGIAQAADVEIEIGRSGPLLIASAGPGAGGASSSSAEAETAGVAADSESHSHGLRRSGSKMVDDMLSSQDSKADMLSSQDSKASAGSTN